MEQLLKDLETHLATVNKHMSEAQKALAEVPAIREQALKPARAKLAKAKKAKDKALAELVDSFALDEAPDSATLVMTTAIVECGKLGGLIGRTSWGQLVNPATRWITQERAQVLLTVHKHGIAGMEAGFLNEMNDQEWLNFWAYCTGKQVTELTQPISDAEKELAELDKQLPLIESPIVAVLQNNGSQHADTEKALDNWTRSGKWQTNRAFIVGDSNGLTIQQPQA